MKIKFYLEKKPAKDDQRAVWCYLREYNQTIALNTGQRVNPELWDSNNQRANPRKTRDSNLKDYLKDLNKYLDSYEHKIWEIERSIRSKDPSIGFDVLADTIKKRFDKKKTTFFDIYDEFLTIKEKGVSKQSLTKYKRIK